MALMKLYFFFSSRRRHTESYGYWSSDVFSSHLNGLADIGRTPAPRGVTNIDESSIPRAVGSDEVGLLVSSAPVVRLVALPGRSEERREGKGVGLRGRWWLSDEDGSACVVVR